MAAILQRNKKIKKNFQWRIFHIWPLMLSGVHVVNTIAPQLSAT